MNSKLNYNYIFGAYKSKEIYAGDNVDNCTDTEIWYTWDANVSVHNAPASGCTLFNIRTNWGITQIAIHYQGEWYTRTHFLKWYPWRKMC